MEQAEREFAVEKKLQTNRALFNTQLGREFKDHLRTFLVVNLAFLVINFLTGLGTFWEAYIFILWGLGMIFHAFGTFHRKNLFYEEGFKR